jgi:hypothetical protein
MDLTFPPCENSEALSSSDILQEHYSTLQAKVLLAVPLPSLLFSCFPCCFPCCFLASFLPHPTLSHVALTVEGYRRAKGETGDPVGTTLSLPPPSTPWGPSPLLDFLLSPPLRLDVGTRVAAASVFHSCNRGKAKTICFTLKLKR